MKVDVQTLGTFNRLSHEGAQQAAAALEQLAGFRTTVEATTVDVATRRDVISDFRGRDLVGVVVEFGNALRGKALLVFDRAGARTLAKNLPGDAVDGADGVESRVTEVGNILVSGFIDGWADHLSASIDQSPPTYVTGSGADLLPTDAPAGDGPGHVLAFSSFLETSSSSVGASVYLFPERASFERVLAGQLADESAPISVDELQVFNRMTTQGAEQASENVTAMTGSETIVEVSRLRFLPIEQTVGRLDDSPYVGITVELEGMPSGYLLILFDEASAAAVAEQLGTPPVEDGFDPMHRSAIEEIGNIMVSGFIDGWANVLETSIIHTPPEFVHDYASAIVDPIVLELATKQEYAFVFDSVVETADRAVTCELLALPDEAELKDALDALTIDVETAADDESLASAMEANYEDLV